MQATLLSVSIAIILALLAALVGPHFVDWSQYRSTFEAEATRLTGMPVRVTGAIDARLLPTPSLVLKDVEAGTGNDGPHARARELSIEFGLGPLLRAHWRASELRLLGPELHVGLNRDGAIDWPKNAADLAPDQLSIDRFVIEGGRIVLSDAGSGGRLVLDRLSFAGEFRSLLGPAKGEGSFEADGESYRYALAAGRLEDQAVKLHVEVDPGDRPWTAEARVRGCAQARPARQSGRCGGTRRSARSLAGQRARQDHGCERAVRQGRISIRTRRARDPAERCGESQVRPGSAL